jgi:hypothetical protein
MIPPFTISGVLPPFVGNSTDPANVSPYLVKMSDVVSRFGITTARIGILGGLIGYRRALASAGVVEGFQIINGSFSEDIEQTELREPNDIDVVTFAYRPGNAKSIEDWISFIESNIELFDQHRTKALYACDAYYVDLEQSADLLVGSTGYWYGLFSHRRSGLWKGMLRVPLQSDDALAAQMLTGL